MSTSPATPDPRRCSQLLVSVRNLEEAQIVAAARVDVIDFKEPRSGPLAPVDAGVWSSAARALPDAVLSAALGESSTAVALAGHVPPVFRFAKVGPSQQRTPSQLERLWGELPLPGSVELVPVAYADHQAADCLELEGVLDSVIATGRGRLLIDTYGKDGRSLTDHFGAMDLAKLIARARAAGIWIALAGSLQLDQVKQLVQQGVVADCWGVRGDVCVRGVAPAQQRAGALDAGRVESWMQGLKLLALGPQHGAAAAPRVTGSAALFR
ncbi:(5-formylfuran-3-yl)methyl phosphate synthase [Allorhodopirellula heiligendammensis]|uniref:(5-formylfuran-3-yl)methyl phosphate synthase n=1 Tax=Allorhodopirellula heiligendammensis TaxID=2714739 RepID=A0A5C6BF98_9BACT|nr:(5-formylfuran-3-yl)methyl phosphate synthase [Allorhodopirellula heiligendammensis]TWU10412.1 hypothetical protein Poly21_43160 [Allorhodopirellula heiligendammensis]